MSPHAVLPDWSRSPSMSSSNSTSSSSNRTHDLPQSPYLRTVPANELHDLVCVGFGPASLAVAVALHDSYEYGEDLQEALPPKVAFLESQDHFAWHAGMQIPGAKMQISFLKDLATQRNPRSHFTFMNYLHQKRRLNQFSNLGTFLPRRSEYEDYLRWCAGHFSSVVSYGQAVTRIAPEPSASDKAANTFAVTSRGSDGRLTTLRTKHVVIAVGGRPKIPTSLPQGHKHVIHSSHYQRFLANTRLDTSAPLRIAVVGGGQSAAEIFSDLPHRFPASKSYLLIKSSALRPSDDSPFVNEVFDPERVDDIYATEPDRRAAMLMADKATNYGVVRLDLLEHMYEELYTQRLDHGNDERDWPRRILANRYVTSARDAGDGSLALALRDTERGAPAAAAVDELRVDLLFVASGYERDMHEELLRDCQDLLPQDTGSKPRFEVQRDYSLRFAEGKVSPDAGVWLQGCNEQTHGLSDTLLSILAVRGGEIVESVFGR